MEQITFQEVTEQVVLLYNQGKFAEAEQMIHQHVDRFPEQAARTTYWRMCLLSLDGRADDTLSVFREGLESGLWWRSDVFEDMDLNTVRDLHEFQRLMAESQKQYEKSRGNIERDYILLLPDRPDSGAYPLILFLHGRNGNKESNRAQWEIARQKGWLVLLAQSTQPLFPGSYCWDDPRQAMDDLRFYHDQVSQEYSLDPQRLVLAGFSQGSGMAMHAALSGKFNARGFIGIASWSADPQSLAPQTEAAKRVRGYFITGEKDHTFETAREIQNALSEKQTPVAGELHPNLAHEFPTEFEKSFDKAIDFIFKEHE
jgi:poly(3-hydroxybutyrate) depolymerase